MRFQFQWRAFYSVESYDTKEFLNDNEEHSCTLERGYKTNSYIFAVNNNSVPFRLDPPPHSETDIEDPTDAKELISEKSRAFLNREDIDFYLTDSFWKNLRYLICSIFFVVCILIFILIIYLVWLNPYCHTVINYKWWKKAVIYEAWTSSFQDSDADGFGDLRGFQLGLLGLRDIGMNVIFPRHFLDTDENGGILNFYEIDKNIGTIDDALHLINEAHRLDLKVIIDFPLVVTSSAHSWFERSAHPQLADNAQFSGFYYWKSSASVKASPFISEYKNSSRFYFHVKNKPNLPVLKWNTFLVSEAIKNALSFWIDKGVDGIHFSFIDYLHRSFGGMQPEWNVIVNFVRSIRDHVMTRSNSRKRDEIFIFASPGDLKEEEKRLLAVEGSLSGVMNTEPSRIALKNRICYENEDTVAGCTNEILSDLLRFYSRENIWPIWSFGSSYTLRMASRLRSRIHSELLFMLEMSLPGTPILYHGDEFGMEDCCAANTNDQKCENIMLNKTIDETGTPNSMHYINCQNSTNYTNQKRLRMLRRLLRLREKDVFRFGRTEIGTIQNNAFAVCRYTQTNGSHSTFEKVVITAVNFGPTATILSLLDLPPFQLDVQQAGKAEILISNSANNKHRIHHILDISTGTVTLEANEGTIFTLLKT